MLLRSSLAAWFHIQLLQNARNAISDNIIVQNFMGVDTHRAPYMLTPPMLAKVYLRRSNALALAPNPPPPFITTTDTFVQLSVQLYMKIINKQTTLNIVYTETNWTSDITFTDISQDVYPMPII